MNPLHARRFWLCFSAICVALIISLQITLPIFAQEPSTTTATVLVSALNVRSGPGMNYRILDTVGASDTLTVLAKQGACNWLHVTAGSGLDGWISGNARYVTLSAPCANIPEVAPGEVAESVRSAGIPPGASIPAGKGCLTITGYVGPEFTLAAINMDTDVTTGIELKTRATQSACLDPGRYTFVLPLPAAWAALGFPSEIIVGELYVPLASD